MHRLFALLHKFRTFFFFAALQVICFSLVVNHNKYQSAAYFNSSNAVVGNILAATSTVSDYFVLKTQNENLALENAELRKQLSAIREATEKKYLSDLHESFLDEFNYVPAKVISNSINQDENFLTLNIGAASGVEVGMGVISTKGVVGQVISVSKHYATVRSLLHINTSISSQLAKNKTLGSTKWNSEDFTRAQFLEVPRHATVSKGDKVVTSGYNSVFPEGIDIGVVKAIETPKHASFHEIELDLATDFSNLYYVYVAQAQLIKERKRLEKESEE